MSLELAGRPSSSVILDRIRNESRHESEKGRWLKQSFVHVAPQERKFEIDGIWRWPNWPEREALTGLDGRDIGIDLEARVTAEVIFPSCADFDCYRYGAAHHFSPILCAAKTRRTTAGTMASEGAVAYRHHQRAAHPRRSLNSSSKRFENSMKTGRMKS